MSKVSLYKKYERLSKNYETITIQQVLTDLLNDMTPKERARIGKGEEKE